MTHQHPFAQFIRILGRGRHGSRSLTEDEAFQAMQMIIRDEVEPVQLGAFLMLIRVREETPEEVAGFVRAIRTSLELPDQIPAVDLDWSSYAGKRRQLPWFILSVLALSAAGIRIFMHGASGHTEGRIYTRDVLKQLGFTPADTLARAAAQLEQHGFTYIDLEQLSPGLHRIIELRPLLGLRSPVHTVARLLNPLGAPAVMQGIFHPGYLDIHQRAGLLLQQPRLAVIKGEGGEIECNPDLECDAYFVRDGECHAEVWPPLFGRRHTKPEHLDVDTLVRVWREEDRDEYGEGAVIATMAMALVTLGRAQDRAEGLEMARKLWSERPRDLL